MPRTNLRQLQPANWKSWPLKLPCLAYFHLGLASKRFGFYALYEKFMLKSITIDEKHNLNLWKKE